MLQGPFFIPPIVQSAVVLCHGYGASGADLADLIPILSQQFPNTAFFCPNGITGLGFECYEWFSLDDYRADKMQTPEYLAELMTRLSEPTKEVHAFIDNIRNNHHLKADDIVVGGFSQGGLVALYAALTYSEKLGGIIGLSTVPILFGATLPETAIRHKPPILLTHGSADAIVPPSTVQFNIDQLKSVGITPDVTISKGLVHGIDAICLDSIKMFLKKIASA